MLVSYRGYSQINIGGIPYSRQNPSYQSSIPVYTTDTLNMTNINAQDIADSIAHNPPRYGYAQSVTLNTNNSGVWKTLPMEKNYGS